MGGNLVICHYSRQGPLAAALAAGTGREAVFSCLRGGWKNLVDLNLRPVPGDAEVGILADTRAKSIKNHR